MFGFAKVEKLSASDVARWLAKHAGEVRGVDAGHAMLYAKASLALSDEARVEVDRVQDLLAQ